MSLGPPNWSNTIGSGAVSSTSAFWGGGGIPTLPPASHYPVGYLLMDNAGTTWVNDPIHGWVLAGPPVVTVAPPFAAHSPARPDPKQPDTLGWREWRWNASVGLLQSPVQGTDWRTSCLTAAAWDEQDVIRGVAGIHALLVPRHWKILPELGLVPTTGVTGIVERYGRYVLGREGWRAEQAVIRELLAPTTEIGLALEQAYPDVIVHYPDQTEEGVSKWTSEKSSGSEKGKRHLSVSLPNSPPPSPSLAIQTFSLPLQSQNASQKRSRREWVGWGLAMLWAVVCAGWTILAMWRT